MKRVVKWLAALCLAAALGLLIRQYVIGFTKVAGDSMSETLNMGDVALVTKLDYLLSTPDRFDIAQIEISGRDGTYIKRIIGLPGDTIEISGGVLLINGEKIEENYVSASKDDYAVTLGADEYFVMGDNRAVSYDSREEDFGVLSADCFRGRVRAVVWPFDRLDFSIE